MYEVIEFFTDLQDFNHPYSVGDVFPRSGMNVSEERLAELSSENNRRGIQLIRKVSEKQKSLVEYTKTQINRMSASELKMLANEVGIADAENLTGGALKKLLIEHFNL
jgi:hypothetical protein